MGLELGTQTNYLNVRNDQNETLLRLAINMKKTKGKPFISIKIGKISLMII